MNRRLIWLAPLVGGVTLLLGLIALMPVAALWSWWVPAGQMSAQRLEGTLLYGHAHGIRLTGQATTLDRLEWTWQPSGLLRGQWAYALQGQALGAPLLVQAGVTPFGSLRVTDAVSGGALRALAEAFGQGFLPVAGQWRLELKDARLRNGWPTTLSGRATLHQVVWALGAPPIPFGDVEAVLGTETDDTGAVVLTATLGGLDGPVEIDGMARMWPDRRQAVDVRLRPRPNAPPMIVTLLANTGAPDAQGWYRLQHQGQLP